MFKFIGASIGKCAETIGCEQAADVIYQHMPAWHENWYQSVYDEGQQRKLAAIEPLAHFSKNLAIATQDVLKSGSQFITFGGDHSCAIGTWSAVAEEYGEFGLIWIDAHMDAHTPESSFSKNPHGMPVAVLLGYGDPRLTSILSNHPKLKPHNIVLIGIRSYEPAEKALLERLGVKVFTMPDVERLGFDACMQQVIHDFTQRQLAYGISFDLDGLDPQDITSLGSPEANGLRLQDVLHTLRAIPKDSLIGVELTEYNPTLDDSDYHDLEVIKKIVSCFIR